MSTTPSVSSHQRHLASRSGRCGHAHAHSVIGVRSCRAECMPIFSQSVCHFSSAFRFTLCRVFLYVSRNPSGQVKTFRDCALQRINSTLCWAHSRRCVKFVPALTQRLASIPARSGSLAVAHRLSTRPVAVLRFAPALWVTVHRAPPDPLTSSCGGVSRLRSTS
jgi:hypothetical protein